MIRDFSGERGDTNDADGPTGSGASISPRRDPFWSAASDRAQAAPPDSMVSVERDDLRQRVRLFMTTSNIPSLRHVDVEIEGDAVILRGKVRSYYEKQIAGRFASRVAGVVRIIDLIEVHAYVPLTESKRPGPASRDQRVSAH